MQAAVSLHNLTFQFQDGPPILQDLSCEIPHGARVLVVGANGVGKSTLLSILAGLHLVSPKSVRILGKSPFHDMELSRVVTWVGGTFPLNLDITVREVIRGTTGARDEELLKLLGISERWRMHQVSDGQRRRVQLFLALRREGRVLLLDEITANLDVTMRSAFLAWLRHESEATGTTVLYATHIFDGLERRRVGPNPHSASTWPTHILWMGFGGESRFLPLSQLPHASGWSLGEICEDWIAENLKKVPHPSEVARPDE